MDLIFLSMLTGGTAIPGACIGIFLGGYILKKLQLQPQGAIKLVLLFNLLCMASYGLLFFLGCNNVAMAGATTSYSSNSRYPTSSTVFTINFSVNQWGKAGASLRST